MSQETIEHPKIELYSWEDHYDKMPIGRKSLDEYRDRPVQASVTRDLELVRLSSPKGYFDEEDELVKTMTTLISHEIMHVVIAETVTDAVPQWLGDEDIDGENLGGLLSVWYDGFLKEVVGCSDLYSDLHGTLNFVDVADFA